MPTPQDNAAGQCGFTLLELLVALTLLSLVGLVMLGGLKFGARVWERTAAVAGDAESVESVQRLLRRQLSAVYPAWTNDGANRGGVVFDGFAESLAYIASPLPQLALTGNERFQLSLSASHALELIWSHGFDGDPGDGQSRAVLLSRVSALEFAYFGPDAAGRDPQWRDSWTGQTRLPQLIRVRVAFPQGDPRTWPELVVHPEIMVDVGCVYDPIYRGCRGR